MKLDDLFNRLSRRQQNEYQTFRESLKNSSLSTQVDTEALLVKLKYRVLFFILTILIVASLIVFFKPKLMGIVLVFTFLILLWSFVTSLKGRNFIRRYIKEEFPNK